MGVRSRTGKYTLYAVASMNPMLKSCLAQVVRPAVPSVGNVTNRNLLVKNASIVAPGLNGQMVSRMVPQSVARPAGTSAPQKQKRRRVNSSDEVPKDIKKDAETVEMPTMEESKGKNKAVVKTMQSPNIASESKPQIPEITFMIPRMPGGPSRAPLKSKITSKDLRLDRIWAACNDPDMFHSYSQDPALISISADVARRRVAEEVDEMIIHSRLAKAEEIERNYGIKPSSSLFTHALYPDQLRTPFDRYLFHHFMETTSQHLAPVEHTENPYRQVYATIAKDSDSPMLTNMILAMSALHLTHLGRLPTGLAATYRQKAAGLLQRALLDHTSAMQDSTLAGVLLSVIYEGLGSGITGWSIHLKGAKALIASRALTQQTSSRISLFLSLHFQWMNALGSTLLASSLASNDGDTEIIEPPSDTLDSLNYYYFLDFPSHTVLSFIRATNELSQHIQQGASTDTLRRLLPSISDTLARIKDWKIPESKAPPPLSNYARHANEVWRQGALVNFYSVVCNLETINPDMQEAVRIGIKSSRALALTANAEDLIKALSWPMFMLGTQTVDPEERAFLEAELINICMTTGVHAFLSIVMMLKEVWSAFDKGESKHSDWRSLTAGQGWELMLLL
ncbi:MAG: hypothetical protein M1834_006923 [Cirrosporium novae-zelandiae]|nr:MAG: hypothetical protein M1834_006923 [Cirrosporium novae-zelandiae]